MNNLNKTLPIAVTEYNMTYGENATRNPHQASVPGAVWAAIVTCSMTSEGVNMANIWESFGQGTYGSIALIDYAIRPVGWALAALKERFPGQLVGCQIKHKDKVNEERLFAMATKREGAAAILLVNYSKDENLEVELNLKGLALKETYEYYELSSENPEGYSEMRSFSKKLVLPSMSIVILTYNN